MFVHDNVLAKLAKDYSKYNHGTQDIFDVLFDCQTWTDDRYKDTIHQVYAIIPNKGIQSCYVKCTEGKDIWLIPCNILVPGPGYLVYHKEDYGTLWSIDKKDLM